MGSFGESTVRSLSVDQTRRLADVDLRIKGSTTLSGAAGELTRQLSAIVGEKVAVVGRRDHVWTVWAESAPERPLPPLAHEAWEVFDRLGDSSTTVSTELWTLGGETWTLVGLMATGEAGVVLVLKGDWTPASSILLQFARHMSLAFRACVLSSRARLRLATHRLARVLTRVSGLRAVCDAIVQHMARVVDARIGALAVFDPVEQQLAILATHGYPLVLVEHLRLEPGEGVIGSVFQSGAAVRVRDVQQFPGLQRRRPRYRTDSFAAVPITAGREVLGVVCVTDRADGQALTRGDVSALRALAAPAALALARERALLQAESYAHAAAVDPVSGLFNRRYFHVRIEEELQRARRHGMPLALLMIDLDDFKVINDSFGHLVGDVVIKETAEILRRAVRVFDVCTRFGGEEFAIVMPGSGAEGAANIAERIRQRIEAYRSTDPDLASLHVTASVGLTVSSPDMPTRELIARADQALYLAKRAGKNCVRAIGAGEPLSD